MASLVVSLLGGDTPMADVLALADGRQFVTVHFGEDARVIAPCVDLACVTYLRTLAAAITAAADKVEADRSAVVAAGVPSPAAPRVAEEELI